MLNARIAKARDLLNKKSTGGLELFYSIDLLFAGHAVVHYGRRCVQHRHRGAH